MNNRIDQSKDLEVGGHYWCVYDATITKVVLRSKPRTISVGKGRWAELVTVAEFECEDGHVDEFQLRDLGFTLFTQKVTNGGLFVRLCDALKYMHSDEYQAEFGTNGVDSQAD